MNQRDVEARRDRVGALALTGRERAATAPIAYLLAHREADVARHCELLADAPRPGEVHVVATPHPRRGQWHLDIAARDRPGLLGAFTGVLAEIELDVVQAIVATWDDGAALQAFVVRAPDRPDRDGLRQALEASLRAPLWATPVADAQVSFDDDRSSLFTSCEVRAADRRGLLHAIAVAMASSGVDIHAAAVTTAGGIAVDRFDVADAAGHKLDAATRSAVVAGIRAGPPARTTSSRRMDLVVP